MSTIQIAQHQLAERANLSTNPIAQRLFTLMDKKKTNLAVAADVTKKEQLLNLARSIGPEICVLKTHIDILEDYDEETSHQLSEIAAEHNFLLFEDRKFADIGNTVKHQFSSGVYKISSWAHIINAHTLPGEGIINGLKDAANLEKNALLLLAQMSSKGTLFTEEYTKRTVEMALEHPDFVVGFICQERLVDDPRFIHMTPGVNLSQKGDSLGQQYNTPEAVVGERGSDIIIVGRGIYQADDPQAAAKTYREAGWQALVKE